MQTHITPVLDITESKGKDKSMVDLPFDFSKKLLSAPLNCLNAFTDNVTKVKS